MKAHVKMRQGNSRAGHPSLSRTLLTVGLSMVTATALGVGSAESASAVSGPHQPIACPSSQSLNNYATADNVSAAFTNSGNTTSYKFDSLKNENPVGGVPGLIDYCVYPGNTQPTNVTAQAAGANGAAWIGATNPDHFAFSRPDSDPSNIPLDGTSTTMGTATFSGAAPTSQSILLHINDADVCQSLYDGNMPGKPGHHDGNMPGKPGHHDGNKPEKPGHHDGNKPGKHNKNKTCFVKPTPPSTACDFGGRAPGTVYSAIPTNFPACDPAPSEAFEAQQVSEFGDEVGLSSTGNLRSLTVDFQSFGCGTSGHWYSGDCVTTPGATFTHPITANIYAVDNSNPVPKPGALLATVTQNQTIPYRPTASPGCTGADAGKWLNPANNRCVNSIPQLLTFNFPAGTALPSQVIWTVAFNTTHYGYNPIGENTTCFQATTTNPNAPGCPYDSLNVGTKTYPGAPYVGTDIDPNGAFLNSSSTGAYCDGGAGGTGTLRLDTAPTDCWADFKPLGEIRIA
ncbi:hypothetical protein [Streptomyces sp. G-G2]|uniref:hypothetical protein n=1 Tax=Streptomyces sp. G-G2 TaxID=3046201 RepID=UPI0024BA3F01|nr:hypothetical protein [Streptomyces sp. G-G2]MDJ0382716.1 hypothetical protein [Streptomyces sp. G-G2]